MREVGPGGKLNSSTEAAQPAAGAFGRGRPQIPYHRPRPRVDDPGRRRPDIALVVATDPAVHVVARLRPNGVDLDRLSGVEHERRLPILLRIEITDVDQESGLCGWDGLSGQCRGAEQRDQQQRMRAHGDPSQDDVDGTTTYETRRRKLHRVRTKS